MSPPGDPDPIAEARRAASMAPDRPEILQHLGLALAARGRLAEAARHLEQATRLAPAFIDAHVNLGIACLALERGTRAARAFRHALAIVPGEGDALHGLGVACLDLREPDRAATHLRRASAVRAGNIETMLNLAASLVGLRRFAEAFAMQRRAIALVPGRATAHIDAGVSLARLDRHEPSIRASRRAAAIDRSALQAHLNAAAALAVLGDIRAAIGSMRAALDAAPERSTTLRHLLVYASYASDVDESVRWSLARELERRYAPPARPAPLSNLRRPERRLTVGYLSSDFHEHPVAYNLAPLIEARDRAQFETIAYAAGDTVDAMTERMRRAADRWRSVSDRSDEEIADIVRRDRVDVLVIAAGRFDKNRPLVAGHRAAPVQVSVHDGGSSGLIDMDYLIADRTLVAARPRRRERFTERVLRLPSFYVRPPMAEAPPVSALPSLRIGHITFGCFNNPAKVNDATLRLWSDVLDAVPGSRLRLKYKSAYDDPALRSRVLRGLAVDPGRVEFRSGIDRPADHLRLYGDVDVALDTYPFTGSTTTWEALWMGVPVVTLMGETLVSRTSASYLRPIGLDDLIATTPAGYVGITRGLAGDLGRLAALRRGLRERVAGSPLSDGRARARQFERLYRATWRRWCRSPGG